MRWGIDSALGYYARAVSDASVGIWKKLPVSGVRGRCPASAAGISICSSLAASLLKMRWGIDSALGYYARAVSDTSVRRPRMTAH